MNLINKDEHLPKGIEALRFFILLISPLLSFKRLRRFPGVLYNKVKERGNDYRRSYIEVYSWLISIEQAQQ